MRGSLIASSAWFAVAVTCAGGLATAAEPAAADIFRVDIGTPVSLLTSFTRSMSCQEFGPPKNAVVCRGGMDELTTPAPESTTFWISDGRVSRIFELTRLGDDRYERTVEVFLARLTQIQNTLGQAPTFPATEPSWFKSLGDDEKAESLRQGRLSLRAVWRLPGRDFSIALRGDRGKAVLVVGLEGTTTGCDDRIVARMLMDLFPPASPATREKAAQALADCKVAAAAGALAAAARTTSEPAVRTGVVRALDQLGPPALPQLEAIAKDAKQDAAAARAGEIVAKAPKAVAAVSEPGGEKPTAEPGPEAAGHKSGLPLARLEESSALKAAAKPAHERPGKAERAGGGRTERPAPRERVSVPRTRGPGVAEAPAPAPSPTSSAPATPPPSTTPAAEPPSLPPAPAVATPEPPLPETPVAKEAPVEPVPPPPPVEKAPKGPPDGTALALTTSLVAGGVWGGGLSLLAQQNDTSVILLVGTAGAVIGGGTAWGLTHFGLRPSPSQAMWFTNSTAWGTLAGLMAWAGSGSDSTKLKWGLLVGGESLGMGMGVLGARKWNWSGPQILFANSLLLGAGLLGAGGSTLAKPNQPLHVSPLVGYGTAPAMVGAALASRFLAPSGNDLHLMAAAGAASAWSGGLLAYGLDSNEATRGDRLLGGLMTGLGAGYLTGALLSPFVEVSPARSWAAGAGMLAGNVIGLGSYMMIEPDATRRRPLWASVGGLGLGVGTFIAYPRLRLGDQAALMALVGAGYGAGTWGLAMATSNDQATARLQGGMMALGTAGGIAGLLASGRFNPNAADYPTTLASAALGATAGIGVGKLATTSSGTGELVGTLAGSALGLAGGALFSHYAELRAPDLGAAALGGAYGALAGALLPTLANDEWGGWQRKNQGGLLVGLPAGVFAGTALAHATSASGAGVGIASVGATLGLGMGVGTGLLWPDNYSRPARIGAIAGPAAGMAGALLLARPLHLDQGLGEAAEYLAPTGLALGTLQGVLLAGIADPSGEVSGATSRQITGGALLGGSAGLAAGLLLSQRYVPSPAQLAVVALGDGAGLLLGRGLAMSMFAEAGRKDTVATLAGSLAGLGVTAAVERFSPFSATDLLAAGEGMAYGGLIGSLAPTLADAEWGGWRRRTEGGLMLGVGGGAIAAAAVSHLAKPAPVTIAISSAGGLLGLGMGTGAGLLWPERYSQPARLGAVVGVGGGIAASLLLERPLRLYEGLGESAFGLGVVAGGLGLAEGILLADLVDPSSQSGDRSRQQRGGALLGGSAGLATGLILSKYFRPDSADLALTVGGGVLGGFAGRGLVMVASPSEGRADAAGTMAGVLAGATGIALAQHVSPFGNVDVVAAGAGLGYGAMVGALAPTLADSEWGGWRRKTEGGALLGMGSGALLGATLSHVAHAEPVDIAVASAGGVLGLGMGTGTGLLWSEGYSRPARIGAVAGVSVGLAASLLLERPLRLREGLGDSAIGFGVLGAGLGVAEGILLAGLVDPSGEVQGASDRQLAGGAWLGGSAGLATGIVLSKFFTPNGDQLGVTAGGAVLGGVFGRGLLMTASADDGRPDVAGTMAGALLGTTALAFTERYAPLRPMDLVAGAAGAAVGSVVGSLSPTLADRDWGGWRRNTEGGLLLGLGGGALAAAGLAHATHVSDRTLGLGMAGVLDGALTGAGVGLLVDQDPQSTQGARIGVVAGAAGGLALGLGLLPRLEYSTDNLIFLSAASAVGGWTGAWSQVLGHGSLDSVDGTKVRGGLLAGAGGASFLSAALLPALSVDTDLVGDALLLDGIFSGAGAGIGALVNRRADAPVYGMLGAGTAGLLLGGSLHERIELEASAGLLAFGGVEGLWIGGWLPYLMRPSHDVTDDDRIAGVAAGGLGGLGLAVVGSTIGRPGGQRLGMASVGSAIGASVAGGSVLLSENLHDQRGVGILLGGTLAGMGLGALVSPYAPLDPRLAGVLVGGAALGAGEGLAFGWAGRATTNGEYAGSVLVGAGVGATLGLASAAYLRDLDAQEALAASGFSAWGGWAGSFAGAFANRDPHEVVLGGLAAANVGFLVGYEALRHDLVEPRDFGWISLAGAMGTALGGGIGAALSTRSDPRPVLAGLALGPVLGIGTGSIVVPYLRHRAEARAAFVPSMRVAGARYELPVAEGKQRNSTDVLAERKESRFLNGLKLAQRHLFDVTNWTPVFGSLPPVPGDPNPAPMFIGVSGGLR